METMSESASDRATDQYLLTRLAATAKAQVCDERGLAGRCAPMPRLVTELKRLQSERQQARPVCGRQVLGSGRFQRCLRRIDPQRHERRVWSGSISIPSLSRCATALASN